MSKRTYVLDSNILICDPNSIFSFQEHNVIIPMVVLEELDGQKTRQDEVGRSARHINRTLDDLRSDGNLLNGVKLVNGGLLRVLSTSQDAISELPIELQNSKVDNLIIALMVQLKKSEPDVVLVTKDLNVRIKCDSLDIRCEDYLKLRVTDDPQKFYRGVSVIEVNDQTIERLFK